jgi:hypothetical protein
MTMTTMAMTMTMMVVVEYDDDDARGAQRAARRGCFLFVVAGDNRKTKPTTPAC